MEQQAQSVRHSAGTTHKLDHRKWDLAGFTEYVLPIGPPNAKLSPKFNCDPSQVGKIPMVCDEKAGHWFGYKGWQKSKHKRKDLINFQRWGAGVGLRGDVFNGGDIDVSNEEIAAEIQQLMVDYLGDAPVRYRDNSPKRLLMYKATNVLHKRRIAFRDSAGIVHVVEWLASGQYYNVDCLHTSGVPYKWRDHPCDIGIGITPATLV